MRDNSVCAWFGSRRLAWLAPGGNSPCAGDCRKPCRNWKPAGRLFSLIASCRDVGGKRNGGKPSGRPGGRPGRNEAGAGLLAADLQCLRSLTSALLDLDTIAIYLMTETYKATVAIPNMQLLPLGFGATYGKSKVANILHRVVSYLL